MSQSPEQPTPKNLNVLEKFMKLLLRDTNPAFVHNFARALFFVAVQLGYGNAESFDKEEGRLQGIQIRLAEKFGELFLEKVGVGRGVRAVKFDFANEGFPIIVTTENGNRNVAVLWSRQVSWAQEKSLDYTQATTEEQNEAILILQIQAQLEEYQLHF